MYLDTYFSSAAQLRIHAPAFVQELSLRIIYRNMPY